MTDKRYSIDDLLLLMKTLRDPDIGCPWDLEQDFKSISHCTIEEAYELFDAIQRGDMPHIQEELCDLLLQVVFYSQFATEQGEFDFYSIVHQLTKKLVRRHPHVFPVGDLYQPTKSRLTDDEMKDQWEAIKKEERENKKQSGQFDDIPKALPALIRANKIQKRMQTRSIATFDEKKGSIIEVLKQIEENKDAAVNQELIGQLLFDISSLAKAAGVDSEAALVIKNQAVIDSEQANQ